MQSKPKNFKASVKSCWWIENHYKELRKLFAKFRYRPNSKIPRTFLVSHPNSFLKKKLWLFHWKMISINSKFTVGSFIIKCIEGIAIYKQSLDIDFQKVVWIGKLSSFRDSNQIHINTLSKNTGVQQKKLTISNKMNFSFKSITQSWLGVTTFHLFLSGLQIGAY